MLALTVGIIALALPAAIGAALQIVPRLVLGRPEGGETTEGDLVAYMEANL